MIAYYFADKEPKDVDSLIKIQDLGLGYAFESMPSVSEVLRGPDGQKGVSIASDALASKVGNQDWEKHETVEGCWIGYPPEIEPESLKRESWEAIPAYTWRGWDVPIARAWETTELATCTLPKRMKFKSGEFCPGPVAERYRRLEEIGSEIVEAILTEQMPDNHFELACEVTAMVYRVGPQEFAKIGPVEWSHQSAFNFLSFVADLPGWIALTDEQKKSKSTSQG